jgi:hypothetical protein
VRIASLIAAFLFILFGVTAPEEHQLTLKEVRQLYVNNNHEYFHDSLPKDTVVEFGNNDFIALDGSLHHALGNTNKKGDQFTITIDPRWAPASITKQATMLHEECHVATWKMDREDHGKHWQACIANLYTQGAFDGLL